MTVLPQSSPQPVSQPTFLGHPSGLAFLFATEMWERFSYYGMRALLVLYMMKYVLVEDHAASVIGFPALKRGLETLFGPLAPQPLASQIFGFYGGLVYLTPIFGGLLADRLIGARRTVVLGAVLMAIGHFMMAFEPLFLFALVMLILGNGAFKPNISTQVGRLYAPGDARRERAYSIFYVGINLGAFLAPLVCGTLGEKVGWHYGFTAAGIGMTIGLLVYLTGLARLPPDEPRLRRHVPAEAAQTKEEWAAIIALGVLFVPVTLFWAAYGQQGNTITLFADELTDRSISLFGMAAEIPTTWFQAFNPFMIFAFTPAIVALWRHQAEKGREPSTVIKMALGCFGQALAYLLLAYAAWHTSVVGKASWLWLFAFFVVLTVAELYLSPVGLSLVSKIAPVRLLSMLMGFWLATSFTGNLMAGWLGTFWTSFDTPRFFLLIGAISGAAGLATLACAPFVRPLLRE